MVIEGGDRNPDVSSNSRENRLLTVEEVARRFKVPKSWLYDRTRPNGPECIPHIKLGKYVRFEEPAIAEFLATRRTEPSVPQPKGHTQVAERNERK